MTVAPIKSGWCKTQGEMLKVIEPEAKALLRDWKQRLIQEALEHVVEAHYGSRWQKGRLKRATPWVCLRCGPRDTSQVKRNGHYQRRLVVLEGVIKLTVPQLRCRQCGKAVALGTLFLPPIPIGALLDRPGQRDNRALSFWSELPPGKGHGGEANRVWCWVDEPVAALSRKGKSS